METWRNELRDELPPFPLSPRIETTPQWEGGPWADSLSADGLRLWRGDQLQPQPQPPCPQRLNGVGKGAPCPDELTPCRRPRGPATGDPLAGA